MTRFSIILPVRNGWPYVQQCVSSILAQDWEQFELIVLDNNSSDQTLDWVRSLGDPRIRTSTSEVPLSIVDSWSRAKAVERFEYMTIIGHDDALDPGYLRAIAGLIERFPDASIYQTGFRLIDANGKRIRPAKVVPERETAVQYLSGRFTYQRDITGTGVVMRSVDYDRVGGIPPFERLYFADDALWLSLLKGSYKACDPAELFSVRLHGNKESASRPSSWPSFLLGLQQFSNYLRDFEIDNQEVHEAVARDFPSFMLRYHRTIYILALIEACQQNRPIDSHTISALESSLRECAVLPTPAMRADPRIRVIEVLNALPTRRIVPLLWTAFNLLRSQAGLR